MIRHLLLLAACAAVARAQRPTPAPTVAFVSNEASRSVSVVDLRTRRVAATIPLDARPFQTAPVTG